MSLLIGAVTIGLILSLLALGVFISFRIFAFPDITAEGSITLGAAVAGDLPRARRQSLDRHQHRHPRRGAGRGHHRGASHSLQNQPPALQESWS